MATRTSRADLLSLVKRLNQLRGKPTNMFKEGTEPNVNKYNVGVIVLEHNAYGYKLEMTGNETGGMKDITFYMKPREMYLTLRGMIELIQVDKEGA